MKTCSTLLTFKSFPEIHQNTQNRDKLTTVYTFLLKPCFNPDVQQIITKLFYAIRFEEERLHKSSVEG